jgi:Snf7
VAIAALKRKKRFEKQLLQIDGTLSTIEFQREALENANTNTEVLKIMGVASKSLKAAHQNLYVYWPSPPNFRSTGITRSIYGFQ